ncbi:uncharacterized protein LOC110773126 [Prunus avium]|uniref:Uncharacterized protein LOC110773126 n=1 Tax=Prunus avium TaxID=42229 RepID=A0A6P5U2J1_PRUAV|nr:uncharacterized protein LOC110773126 [Prunus avium]
MEATDSGGGGMEDLTGPLRSNDERSLYICSMVLNNVGVSYAIHSIKLSDLFSSSCSCSFDPDLPTNPKPNPNPAAIGYPDLPLNPTTIGGDGDRSKCPCLSSLKAPDEEDCCELNHPDDTPTRTECAACSKGNSELCHRASLTGEFLPAEMGCGVFGSQIVFAGGFKSHITKLVGPHKWRFGPDASRATYGFETRDPNPTIEMSGRERMFGKMFGKGICDPLLVEVSGKLYALARQTDFFLDSTPSYFQVFDPNFKKWSPLPAPPILEKGRIMRPSFAIMGNFILMSTPSIPVVHGFDTENDAGWIEIGTPRFFDGRSLPFKGKALAVADNNGYFLFTFGKTIIVHFIGADHGQVIKELPLPQDMPVEFRKSELHHSFIQVEGHKVCLVLTLYTTEKFRGMVLTFEFSPRDVKHVHTRYFSCDITWSTMIGAFVL